MRGGKGQFARCSVNMYRALLFVLKICVSKRRKTSSYKALIDGCLNVSF